MRVLKLLGGIFGLMALVCGLVAVIRFANHLFQPYEMVRELGREQPNLYLQPKRLVDSSHSRLEGARLSQFGYSFQVPWTDVATTRLWSSIRSTSFSHGVVLVAYDMSSEPSFATTLRSLPVHERETMREIFGPHVLDSNFEFEKAALRSLPSDAKWWGMPKRNVRTMLLVSNKQLELLNGVGAIYELEAGASRGFQFGDPAVAPHRVMLELFDKEDRCYKVMIASKDESKAVITQPQINALVASIDLGK